MKQAGHAFPDHQQILEQAKAAGATAAELHLSNSTALTVIARAGDVESVEFQQDRDLSVTVYIGQRTGHASSSDWSSAGIQGALDAALAIAAATGEDPCNGLAPAERMATEFPELSLYHPWPLAVPEAIELAKACEAAALAADPRIKQSEGATLETRSGSSLYANSHGFCGRRQGSNHYLGCSVIAQDSRGMQRDYAYTSSRNPELLIPGDQVGRQAGQQAAARLGVKKLAQGRYPVLFRADVARSLIGHFIGAISGGALYRKSSFLLDRAGEQVFSDRIQLRQMPFIPGAPSSAAYDAEGVATSERDLVRDGVLQGYLLSSYSARKLGLETTGNAGGVYNLLAAPTTEAGEQELLQQMGRGLLVTEMMGQGANPVTGDYSRGAAGFWVENGEIQHPVEEITVAGNLLEMYQGIAAVGSDIDARAGIQCGAILVDGLTVAAG